MNFWDSLDQRPPTSTPNTTKRLLVLGPHQLRVPSLFPTSSCLQSDSRCVCRSWSRRPVTAQCTHDCGVHCKLGSAKQRKPIGHDLQTPAISDSCDHTLKSKSPFAQNPCPCTSSAVVAKLVDWAATPATMHGQREGQLETAQEEDPEVLATPTVSVCKWGMLSKPDQLLLSLVTALKLLQIPPFLGRTNSCIHHDSILDAASCCQPRCGSHGSN